MSSGAGAGRAVVLGGGGVTGIAWESGILAGLYDTGIDLSDADVVIGTSAGAFVGAALASGYDLERYFAMQAEPAPHEQTAVVSEDLYAAWTEAVMNGGGDAQRIGAAFGRIATTRLTSVTEAQRRRTVRARLVTSSWPERLQVTALDTDTGRLHQFDAASGVPLLDAVMASGAVPGISPTVSLQDRTWADGGMVSAANAQLAAGYDAIVVLAPIADGYGGIPSVADDATILRARSRVALITPDAASLDAIGPNPYDPDRRAQVAAAARAQARACVADVATVWA